MSLDAPGFNRRMAAITFLVGVSSLMFELVQVRMLAFLVGKSMDFLAIPVALFGLALGSMGRHFLSKSDDRVLIGRLAGLALPAMLFSFIGVFLTVNQAFPDIHVAVATPGTEASKVVAYSLLFLPPYIVFGALFASLFSAFSDQIGRLYFFDLAGAAMGCVLTPWLLTFVGLPYAIVGTLAVGATLALVAELPSVWKGLVGTLWAVAAVGAGWIFVEHPNPDLLARSILPGGAEQIDARWNEIARTALMRDAGGKQWAIVQDNGLSNVTVHPYVPPVEAAPLDRYFHYSAGIAVGGMPESVLVMFAGVGRDLIHFNHLTNGEARLTGVEINPTVVEWQSHPALHAYNIDDFLDLDRVNLHNREGRDFLNTTDETYDLIYVANNGAVHASRTGHTRKFLDTYEAMAAYLDRLEPDGVMVFTVQPVMDKIPSLRRLLEERGLAAPKDAIYVWGKVGIPVLDSMVFKPSGFTPEDVAKLDAMVIAREKMGEGQILAKPGHRAFPRLESLLVGQKGRRRLVTDDRPFTSRVKWEEWSVWPNPDRYFDARYVSGWVKVFTVVLFAGVCGAVALIAMTLGGARQRVPAVWVGYLLLTGVGYMCVEIPLIAKTELFIGNPLYAVSINLASFLVFNAVGAQLQETRAPMQGPRHLAAAVVIAVAWGLLFAQLLAPLLLSAPLVGKAFGVAFIVFPAGIVLGMFYPFCVGRLVRAERGEAVPMTYGLTTLSSVLGSAFAMTAIINLGFTKVILFGVALYVIGALLTALDR